MIDIDWLWLKLIEVIFQSRAITSWLKSIRSISITFNHISITFNQARQPFNHIQSHSITFNQARQPFNHIQPGTMLCTLHFMYETCEPKSLILRFIAHSRFQAKPATLLIPSDFFFLFAVLYGTWYQSGSFSLINMMGSGFHCLRSFFLLFPPLITHHCFVACRLCHSGDSWKEGCSLPASLWTSRHCRDQVVTDLRSLLEMMPNQAA